MQTSATGGCSTKDVDRNGQGLTFADTYGQLTSVTDAIGSVTTFSCGTGYTTPLIKTITDPTGRGQVHLLTGRAGVVG